MRDVMASYPASSSRSSFVGPASCTVTRGSNPRSSTEATAGRPPRGALSIASSAGEVTRGALRLTARTAPRHVPAFQNAATPLPGLLDAEYAKPIT